MAGCYEHIIWKDAVSIDEWTHVDEITPTYHTIETFGIVIKESSESVVIGLNHDLDADNFSCFIHIPTSMIIDRYVFKATRQKEE